MTDQTPFSTAHERLPAEVHSQLVDTLFNTVGSFLAGLVGAEIVPLVAYLRSGDPLYLAWGLGLALLGALRIATLIAYRTRERLRLPITSRGWEALYALGAIAFMTAVGLMAAALFHGTHDPVSRLYAIVISIGCAGALAARNAARPFVVYGQVLGVCGPIAVALAIEPHAWLWGVSAMIVLIMISVKSTTRLLNQIIVAALLESRERRRAAAALDTARQTAEAASQAKTAFLANMSHEIRTPLNGVLGMAQAMALDDLSTEQRERLEIIQSAGEALLHVLNDILDISKIEAGRIELEDGVVDFREIGMSAQATFSGVAREKGIALEMGVSEAAQGCWRGDPSRVRQILQNLVSNALKFTDEGCVRIDIDHDGERIRMSVTDTGPGIARDRHAHLFEKFAQADASTTRRYGGTGLGLAICRELALLMGGDVSLDSEPGAGACFTVALPLPRSERPAAPPPIGEAMPAEAPGAIRILAAEDNMTNQLVLKTLLSQLGFQPEFVADGEAAVRAWRAQPWDVILMDVQMPIMDGVAATRTIRLAEAALGRGHTPIIALTANAMSHQTEEYRRAGMDHVVAKPIKLTELVLAIQAVLAAPAPQASGRRAAIA